jgi:hypothetical protein
MKFSFWRWVRNKINKVDDCNAPMKGSDCVVASDAGMGEKKIEFTMHFAEGGVVLQKYQYDPIKDRSHRKLFIISDDKDVAKEVGDFVAMEILRS